MKSGAACFNNSFHFSFDLIRVQVKILAHNGRITMIILKYDAKENINVQGCKGCPCLTPVHIGL